MKLLPVTLVISYFLIFDLVSSFDEEKRNDSIKETEKPLAITPLTGVFKGYYVSVTDKEAKLLWKSYKTGTAALQQVDSEPFPDGFKLENAQFRFSYLLSNKSVLVCRNNVVSIPQCLLLPVLAGDPNPIFGQPLLIRSSYNQKLPTIWNTFQVVSTNSTDVLTAFLNGTGVYEPSWIIRESLDPSSALITTGIAFDHRLLDLQPPYNASENVFAFERDGFAYFLRYAYRYKVGGEPADFEWVWQLTRVCLNDQTKDLQSRASLPLNCSFSINSAEEPLGWRPTNAYFDEVQENLYLYVQPNYSLTDRDRLKEIRHRICSFDMKLIANEFDRMFSRCYDEFSHVVAAHTGVGTFATASCHDYKRRYEESLFPKCPIDMCSPREDCNQMYHLEIYTPINGTTVSVIDFRYQAPADIDSMDEPPLNMYVTSSLADNGQNTTQAFIRNARGTLFMVFLNSTKAELNAPHAPAWTNVSVAPFSSSQLVELDDHSGLELIDGVNSAISTFKPDCSIYTRCRQLMAVASGEQARRLWGCGWCTTADKDFSTTEQQCLRAKGDFQKDACPTKADCYEPRSWLSDDNVTMRIYGHFPHFFDYKITVCGAECRDTRRSGKEPDESLTCTAYPPYHLHGPSCGIEILVIDPINQSGSFTVRPACGPPIPSTVNGVPIPAKADKIVWWIFAVVSAVVVFSVIAYASVRCHRRQQKKRRRNDDSFTLPMTVTMEISHNNEYVQRRVHQGNHVRPTSRGNYEDLSFMVPSKLLIRLDSIDWEGRVGNGHFGEVFKARFRPAEGQEPSAVAVKTLIGERNARQFLQEGIIMETFDHPNVLSLIGIAFGEDHLPMIITPYMGKGDLLRYIRNPQNSPDIGQLLTFGLEIAAGMQYLHKLKFIHRDLAARNCMLDDNLHVKIADFGLSRDVYESECYLSAKHVDLPIRWMPPESIEHGVYTLKSDVWSYGVVLWELTTRGKVPFAGMSGFEVLSYLKSGRRLQRFTTPEEAFEIMLSCWLLVPEDRPDFLVLSERLGSTIVSLQSTILKSPPYYNIAPVTQQFVTSA